LWGWIETQVFPLVVRKKRSEARLKESSGKGDEGKKGKKILHLAKLGLRPKRVKRVKKSG